MVNTQNNGPVKPGEFLLYETEDGRTRVECRFIEDSLWLTQALMADLFQVKVPTINEHLKRFMPMARLNLRQPLGNS